jgi:hypothetical protein
MFEQKRFTGRHLLTFESQKLNYFGKKKYLTPSILFNIRYEKIKTYMANLFTYFYGALPRLFREMKVC